MMNKKKEATKGFSLWLIVGILLFMGVVYLFFRITDEFVLEEETAFDMGVFGWMRTITNGPMTNLMLFFTFFGSTKFLLPAYILLAGYFLFVKRTYFRSMSIAIVGLSSIGLLYILKWIFHRHRPLEPLTQKAIGFSYPSGHSFSSFTFCGILLYIIWHTKLQPWLKWTLSIVCILFASFIAFSRVYLHVHFASDVLAGLCLSIIWLAICWVIFNKLQPKL